MRGVQVDVSNGAALASWVEPVNNLLVADSTGAVRQRVVGRVPERDEVNRRVPDPNRSSSRFA